MRTSALAALVAATVWIPSLLLAQNAPTSQPTSQPLPQLDKKWHDELAKPLASTPGGKGAVYGSKPKNKKTVPLAAIQANAAIFEQHDIRVDGTITGICMKKGCWLTLDDAGQELFVKFKDYSFFVPRHLTGHRVSLEGRVLVTTVTQAERRHYAEDAGLPPEEIEKIVGDEVKLTMTADSVVITEPKPQFRARVELEFGPATQVEARLQAPVTALSSMPLYGRTGQKLRVKATITDVDTKNGEWLLLQDGGTRIRVAVLDFGKWSKLIQSGPTEVDAWLEWGQGWTATSGAIRVQVPVASVLEAMDGKPKK